MTPETFRQVALEYCLAFSASESSGYRTIQHNAKVGGTAGGPHPGGVGADVVYDGSRPGAEADRWLAARGVRRFWEADHDHLQPSDWRNDVRLALEVWR